MSLSRVLLAGRGRRPGRGERPPPALLPPLEREQPQQVGRRPRRQQRRQPRRRRGKGRQQRAGARPAAHQVEAVQRQGTAGAPAQTPGLWYRSEGIYHCFFE